MMGAEQRPLLETESSVRAVLVAAGTPPSLPALWLWCLPAILGL